ncbi:hypothetical protein ABZS86_14410 [Streptomyces sp. NPDC005355]|uniref:hypothetical protein n=1 Tax=Streptomyces sp. NPDC005355 TaxID=3157038 RepID=UPI0033AF2C16
MTDVSWADGLSAVSALAGAVTAFIALRISRTANEAAHQSNRAADRANATADSVAEVERERWHHEMTPRFDVTITRLGSGSDQASLLLTFEGPPALERLDAVEIEIRDDGYTHGSGLAGGPSQQDIDETIWGPYRFKPGIDGASTNGRKVPAAAMELGEWRKLALEQSFAPAWTDGAYWRNQYAGAPVRLWVRCRREGHQPWVLTYNVDVANPQ